MLVIGSLEYGQVYNYVKSHTEKEGIQAFVRHALID